MKKYLVLTFTVLFCLSLVFSASAQALSGAKQDLINKISANDNALQTQLVEKAVGSAEYQVTQLDGSLLMMAEELANIKGSKLKVDYKLNTPANQIGLNCNINYNGQVYQGDIFISGTKIIFSKDLIQLVKMIEPNVELPAAESLPQYFYLDEPELTAMWKSLIDSKGQPFPPELKDLLAFVLEAVPDKYVTSQGGNISVKLDQKAVAEVIVGLAKKITAEPERFADSLSKFMVKVDPSKSPKEIKEEILADLQEGIKSGEFAADANKINEAFKEAGIEQFSLNFVTPKGTDGESAFNMDIKFNNDEKVSGQVTLAVEQKRTSDKIDGTINMDIAMKAKEENVDIGLKLAGTYGQAGTEAKSDMTLTLNVQNSGMALINAGLKILSQVAADNNVQVNVPELTPDNSMDISQFKIDEAQPKEMGLFEREVDVYLVDEDEFINFDVQPFIKNKRTMVPIRALAEATGFEVKSVNEKDIYISKDNCYIVMHLGDKNYTVNGKAKSMDVAPFVRDGRTMVPLRFVAQELGYKVEVFGDGDIVELTKK